MLKGLLSNKEKLLELENTPLNEHCSKIILKKLPKKLGDPGKFLISCSFSELKCKALGLLELISTRMTLKLANRAICTPARIARDVFVLVGKVTFPADFVIISYESDPRVPLILGRPFLRTAHALIDVYGEEMILHDDLPPHNIDPLSGSTTSSSHSLKTSVISDYSLKEFADELALIDSFPPGNSDMTPEVINLFFGNPTSSSLDHLLEEFVDELALITFPPGNDDLYFDIESNLKEIKYLLNHDPTKEMDSIFEDLVDEGNIANPNNNLFHTIPEMFADEHTLDYSSPPLYDDFGYDLVELESDNEYVYDDPFDSKGDKIKTSKLLIDELDPPRSSDFLASLEYDSFL
nr:hypothetical protein [Tanacetum cinerariifolium]